MRKLSHGASTCSMRNEQTPQNDESKVVTAHDQSHHIHYGEMMTTLDSTSETISGANDQDDVVASHSDHDREDTIPVSGMTAALISSNEVDHDRLPMSKNQMKKLRKKQEWDAKREERKVIRKQKIAARRERKRALKAQEGFDAGSGNVNSMLMTGPKPPIQNPVQLPVTFLIDCDFDDLMRDNERISLAAQITRCYSDNKNSLYRAHLAICSFTGRLRERFDNVLTHYKQWRGVRFLECDFVEAAQSARDWMSAEQHGGKLLGTFTKFASLDESEQLKLKNEGEVIYLSSESDETLTELKPFSTYIIGGLVDKNREKGICHKRAMRRSVKTARLPIGEFMEMQSRKVLATNHVNEIMLKWLECGDWGEAFMKAIPKRKGGKLKSANDQGVAEGTSQDGTALENAM